MVILLGEASSTVNVAYGIPGLEGRCYFGVGDFCHVVGKQCSVSITAEVAQCCAEWPSVTINQAKGEEILLIRS